MSGVSEVDEELRLAQTAREVAAHSARLEAEAAEQERRRAAVQRLRAEASERVLLRVARLEQRAGCGCDDLVRQLVTARVEEAQRRALQAARARDTEVARGGAAVARRLVSIALERYDGVGHLERLTNTIPIEDERTREAFRDPAGAAARAFFETAGCELEPDEAAFTVRGDDPLAREIARRLLRQLANKKSSDPDVVRSLGAAVTSEVEREVQNAGKKAVRQLEVGSLHPEVLGLVGRLKFRLSYSQNQWKHAIEVGYLAGILAAELGLDVRLARRGGLLHDIGKAMTHEREGSHAVLGAAAARRCAEVEVVSNAIGSHHFDEPPAGALAYIVTAADALSGARPGARRESAQAYVERIRAIQEIAGRAHRTVERVDIMHAGREVRVVVGTDERGETDAAAPAVLLRDADLHPLAQRIARELEEQITFAGQIRVTVIRETRAVTTAR